MAADESGGDGVAVRETHRGVLERPPPFGPIRDDPPDAVPHTAGEAGVPAGVDGRSRGSRAARIHGPGERGVAGSGLGAPGGGGAGHGGGAGASRPPRRFWAPPSGPPPRAPPPAPPSPTSPPP